MLRAQLEMSQVRQEIDRRIQEKEEEFEHSRKNHQRALESMQASLEAEARAKEEALRIKKKNEADINEVKSFLLVFTCFNLCSPLRWRLRLTMPTRLTPRARRP